MASEALIRISRRDEDVSILISDNGKGFSMSKYKSSKEKQGLGLAGITERVKLLNGTLEIETEERRGTKLKIMIPINFRNQKCLPGADRKNQKAKIQIKN